MTPTQTLHRPAGRRLVLAPPDVQPDDRIVGGDSPVRGRITAVSHTGLWWRVAVENAHPSLFAAGCRVEVER